MVALSLIAVNEMVPMAAERSECLVLSNSFEGIYASPTIVSPATTKATKAVNAMGAYVVACADVTANHIFRVKCLS